MTWSTATLGELSKGAGQYGVGLSSREWRVGDPRYIRITDIDDEGRLNSSVVAPDGGRSDWEKATLQEGDLLFARSGATVGKTYLHGADAPPAVYAGYLIRFQLDTNRALPDYVFRFTKGAAYRAWVASSQRAVAQPNINAKQYASLPIPLPPLDQQRRIAAILDQAEHMRSQRLQVLDHLRELASELFIEAFGDELDGTICRLDEIAVISSGITKGRKTSEPTRRIPYLAVVNVQAGHLVLEPLKEIDATESEIGRYSLKDGDLVLTEGGDPDKLGRGTVWRCEVPLCLHQNHIFRVRIRPDSKVEPQYLSAYLASWTARSYFLRSAKQTTGIASINMTQLRALPVLVPPLLRQRDFLDRVEAVTRQTASCVQQLAEIELLTRSLQSRAFSGWL